MASPLSPLSTALFVLAMVSAPGIRLSECTNFTIVNHCRETIWPGITTNGNPPGGGGGFALKPDQSAIFIALPGWGGRIWGRTGCSFDNGTGTCQTGSCGGSLKCSSPGQPPVSIVEFNSLGSVAYYDVSLVDGFNLPLTVTPVKGKGNCSVAGCDSDLRANCSSELALKSPDGKTIACRSACNAFNTDEYCCRGAYSDQASCLPTNYSRAFKQACPAAYSYANDHSTSLITCTATDYVVAFCSSRNQKVCTYHDEKLVCNGSDGLKLNAIFQSWWIFVLALLPMLANLQITF